MWLPPLLCRLVIGFLPLCSAQVVICAVVRNEAAYLEEWILYHSLAGVERLMLYENNSTDDWRSVVKQFPNVQVIDWSAPGDFQIAAYGHCLEHANASHVALIDVDEFLAPVPLRGCLDNTETRLPWFTVVADGESYLRGAQRVCRAAHAKLAKHIVTPASKCRFVHRCDNRPMLRVMYPSTRLHVLHLATKSKKAWLSKPAIKPGGMPRAFGPEFVNKNACLFPESNQRTNTTFWRDVLDAKLVQVRDKRTVPVEHPAEFDRQLATCIETRDFQPCLTAAPYVPCSRQSRRGHH